MALQQLGGQKASSRSQAEQLCPQSLGCKVTLEKPWGTAGPNCKSWPVPMVSLVLEGAFKNFGKVESSCSGGIKPLARCHSQAPGCAELPPAELRQEAAAEWNHSSLAPKPCSGGSAHGPWCWLPVRSYLLPKETLHLVCRGLPPLSGRTSSYP